MQSRALPHQGRTALLDRPRLEVSFARLVQSALAGQQACCHATLLEGSTALQGHRQLCYVRRGITAPGAERRLWNAWHMLEGSKFVFRNLYSGSIMVVIQWLSSYCAGGTSSAFGVLCPLGSYSFAYTTLYK